MRRFIPVLIAVAAYAQPVLRLKVPPVLEKTQTRQSRVAAPVASGRGHLIVQFGEAPTAAAVAELRARGANVLQDVPDNAVLISVSGELSLEGLDATYAAPLESAQKLSPQLALESSGYYIVEFHPDVDMADARRVILDTRAELRDNPDLGPHRLMIQVPVRARAANPLPRIAAKDEVAYIFPASADLASGVPVVPCASALTDSGMLGQYIATVGSGWDGAGQNAATLGYVFGAPTARIPAAQAQAEILRAMQEWSKVVQLTWQPGTNPYAARTLHILFGRGYHGDNYPFDGPGKVLAHTFYPAPPNAEPIAGDMHLDEDETWRVGAHMDLFSVALHELGHALGLAHSDDPNAVMYPYYRMVSTLASDDRNAIRTLYAAASESAPPPPPPPPPAPAPAPAPTPTPAPADTTAPSLTITSPSTSIYTTLASRTIYGLASDNVGVASVTWSTNFGASGHATGTTNWSAAIPLIAGINTVTVRAFDAAGNSSWRSVVIVRR